MAYVPVKDPKTGQFVKQPGYEARRPHRVLNPSPPMSHDGRRLYSRRLKAIEAALRAELERQGRLVDLVMLHRIGAAAQAAVQLEICRAKRSLGEVIPEDIETRWINALDRALNRIGIKPAFLQPPKPKPSKRLTALLRDGATP